MIYFFEFIDMLKVVVYLGDSVEWSDVEDFLGYFLRRLGVGEFGGELRF